MVHVLSPPPPNVPEAPPGQVLSLQPSPHIFWVDDFEYYNQLGQDPLQQRKIWGIADDTARVDALKQLLEYYPKTRHRRRILQTAAKRGDEALVRCLVETGLKVHPDIEKAKEDEEERDSNTAELDEDGGVPDTDDVSVAPVHMAAVKGHLSCVKIMLEQGGVHVDVRDEFGRTPLLAAAGMCKLEVIRYLLDEGANPTARSLADDELTKQYLGEYAGADALEMLALHGNVEALQLLLQHPIYGSTQKRKYRDGVEPGVWVTELAIKTAACSRCEALMLLLEQGAYPTQDKDGMTKRELLSDDERQTITDSLPNALELAELSTLKLLLSYLYPVDEDGELLPFEVPKPLHRTWIYATYDAVKANMLDKFEYLHSFGLREHETMSLDPLPEGQLLNVQHLLDKATENGALDCVKLLIEKYGAQPDKHRIPPGIRPMYVAAAANRTGVVRYLLANHDIDLHMGSGRYSAGATALFIAIILKSLDTIAVLLQHGGPIDEIDDEIRNISNPITAILRAEDSGITSRVLLQTEYGAQEYLDRVRDDWQMPNPWHVLLHLTPDDKGWISKLQLRRGMEELREMGESARELNKVEGALDEDLDESDVRKLMGDGIPTLKWRQDELNKIDGLLPKWRPWLIPTGWGNY